MGYPIAQPKVINLISFFSMLAALDNRLCCDYSSMQWLSINAFVWQLIKNLNLSSDSLMSCDTRCLHCNTSKPPSSSGSTGSLQIRTSILPFVWLPTSVQETQVSAVYLLVTEIFLFVALDLRIEWQSLAITFTSNKRVLKRIIRANPLLNSPFYLSTPLVAIYFENICLSIGVWFVFHLYLYSLIRIRALVIWQLSWTFNSSVSKRSIRQQWYLVHYISFRHRVCWTLWDWF